MRRRRFIKLMASALPSLSVTQVLRAGAAAVPEPHAWSGYLLGASGGFRLYGGSAAQADATIERCFREIRRLEAIFSLYDRKSEIARLNADGRLLGPASDWQVVLGACRRFHTLTHGAFDPTVQPLWELYAKHFALAGQTQGPAQAVIDDCRARVGFDRVNWSRAAVEYALPGMAMTLNGIAQGYISDRVSGILRDAGYSSALVELGETRALGRHPSQTPWRIGVVDVHREGTLFETIELDNRALATSAPGGSPFEPSARFHHLLDPVSGRPSASCASASVVADEAMTADALATALVLSPPALSAELSAAVPGLRISKQARIAE